MKCVRLDKTKQKMLSLCIIIALAVLIVTPMTQAQSTNTSTNLALDVPQAPLEQTNHSIDDFANFTTWLAQRGYKPQDLSNLTGTEAANLLLSMSGQDMNKSMNQIRQDLFGNSTGPIPVPHKTVTQAISNEESLDQTSINDQIGATVTESPTSGHAILVVAIWDYPGANDLYYVEFAYNAEIYNVNYAGYDYVKTLTNSAATHENIWEWLTWLCATYQNVDVYLAGHGYSGLTGLHAFCPYDSITTSGIDYSHLYYASEMRSYATHPYDYSELRVGVGCFCYAAYFYGSFVHQPIDAGHPNLSDTKSRVWMGGWGEVLDQYMQYFSIYWAYSWYVQHVDSLAAYNIAYDEAFPYHGSYSTISYFYNTLGEESITFPTTYYLEIFALDDYDNLLFNDGIYLDGNYVGSGWANVQITLGWHSIDADNPVFDYFLGYDVWIQDGTGSILITGSTTNIIRY